MSNSQYPEDSRALCTRTVPVYRSLDTGLAGIHRAACDRAECAGASGHRAAGRTKSAANRLDARVIEPTARPRPPALQARARAWTRPWLSPAWLVPRLVPAALALVPPSATASRIWRWTACGVEAGGLHPGRGVAWAGAASRLGGPALPVAQGTLHADGVRADPPGGCGLACRAAGAPGG